MGSQRSSSSSSSRSPQASWSSSPKGKSGTTGCSSPLRGIFGAYFASETFPGSTVFESIKNWRPHVDGFYIIRALIAGAVLAMVAFVGTGNLETTVRTAWRGRLAGEMTVGGARRRS